MSYSIRPLYFAPMIVSEGTLPVNVHAIVYDKCNFNCSFCTMRQRDSLEFHEYSDDEFVIVASQLVQMSPLFKFTGGEPTLNKHLSEHLSIVKDLGGKVFIDTNGSRPEVLESLLDNGLVDLVAISLKGLEPEMAVATSRCTKPFLCWDNVTRSIDICNSHHIPTIVTYVFTNESKYSDFRQFVDMFVSKQHVILKFNNLMFEESLHNGFAQKESTEFLSLIERVAHDYPELKGRVIAEADESCITNYDSLLFY